MGPQHICYHGTDEESAKLIIETGFRPGTYFGFHLEDALGYGGEYMFEVAFPRLATAPDRWQFTTDETIPPSRIVAHYRLQKTDILKNEKLRKQIFHANKAWKLAGGQ